MSIGWIIYLISILLTASFILKVRYDDAKRLGMSLCDLFAFFFIFFFCFVPGVNTVGAIMVILIGLNMLINEVDWEKLCKKQIIKPFDKPKEVK